MNNLKYLSSTWFEWKFMNVPTCNQVKKMITLNKWLMIWDTLSFNRRFFCFSSQCIMRIRLDMMKMSKRIKWSQPFGSFEVNWWMKEMIFGMVVTAACQVQEYDIALHTANVGSFFEICSALYQLDHQDDLCSSSYPFISQLWSFW